MKKNKNATGGEKPAFEIVKSPDLGYYSIRYGDFTIATFNFASFAEYENLEIKEGEMEAILRIHDDNTAVVRLTVRNRKPD